MPDILDETAIGDDLLKNKGKKDKKDRGYVMFEQEDSEEELVAETKSKVEFKQKKLNKPTFKFPKKEHKREIKEQREKDKKDKYSKTKDNIKESKPEKEFKEKKVKEKKIEKDELKKEDDNLQQTSTTKPKWKRKFIVKMTNEDALNIGPTEDKAIFGVPLQTAIDRNPSYDGVPLPVVVRLCIDYISEYGMTCEGIYRISGVKSKVQQLKDAFNSGIPDSVNLIDYEPNVVAGLLKQYLRELPETVLTNKLAALFEQASALKNIKEKVEKLLFLIEQLPLPNRTLLSWIILHMTQIIAKEKQNKMSLQNVSIVLSPTMQISHRVLNALFTYSRILFKDTTIKRYILPLKPATSRWILELPESQQELEDELLKQESLLGHLHEELTRIKDEEKEEQLWEVQRVVTQLKRKLKLTKQVESEAHPTCPTYLNKLTKSEGMQAGTPLSSRADFYRHSRSPRSSKKSDKSSIGEKSSLGDKSPIGGEEYEKSKVVENLADKNNSPDDIRKEVVTLDKTSHEDTETKGSDVKIHNANLAPDNSKDTNSKGNFVEKSNDLVATKTSSENIVLQVSKHIKSENISHTTDLPATKNQVNEDSHLSKEISLKSSNQKTQSLFTIDIKGKEILNAVPANTEISTQNNNQLDKQSTGVQIVSDKSSLNSQLERKNSELSLGTDNSSLGADTPSIGGGNRSSFGASPFGGTGQAYLGDEEESNSSDDYTDVCSDDDGDNVNNDRLKPQVAGTYEKLVGDESPSASFGIQHSFKAPSFDNQLDNNDTTCSDSSATSDFESVDNVREFEKLLKEHTYLMMEEEELLAIGDELRQKISTELNETERLEQDIAELQLMREQDAFDSASMTSSSPSITSSSSSADEDDDEKLLEELKLLKEENDNLEHANTELCEKIHQERMICVGVKINIRMIQQKQTEVVDLLTDQESLI